jgi:Leucine Rich repeat
VTNPRPPSRWRRWVTYRLRSLLLLATAIAMVLAAWRQWVEKPYERQQAALAALGDFAERVEFQDPGPRWLPEWVARRLRRAVSLHLERLAVRDEHLAHLEGLPHLERLYLARTRITDEGLEHLAGLTRLRRLSLWGTAVSDEGLQRLAGLRQLEALDIHETKCTQACLAGLAPAKRMQLLRIDCELDDQGLADLARLCERSDSRLRCRNATLAGLSHLRRLRGVTMLSLQGTVLHADEARAIVEMAGLASLDAREGQIDRAAVAVLRNRLSLKQLYLLDMGIPVADVLREYASTIVRVRASTGAVELFVRGPRAVVVQGKHEPFDLSELSGASELRSLSFIESEYHGAPVDFRRLAKLQELVWIPPLDEPQVRQLGALTDLNYLELRLGPGISPAAFQPFSALRNLQKLGLVRCHLTDEHLSFLKGLVALRELHLGENPLQGGCLVHCRNLPQLQRISLQECRTLDEANLKHLAAIKSLALLTLQYTPVSDAGLNVLHGMPNLKDVALLGTRVTPPAKAALKATLPAGANVY